MLSNVTILSDSILEKSEPPAITTYQYQTTIEKLLTDKYI